MVLTAPSWRTKKEPMADTYILATDLAKRSFQVCATDRAGSVLYNRTMSQAKLEQLLCEETARLVAMEACATGHFWGRHAEAMGHEVRLSPPVYVKPFVKRQKNDAAADAAIAEAAVRPNMHYVAVNCPKLFRHALDQSRRIVLSSIVMGNPYQAPTCHANRARSASTWEQSHQTSFL
jgi:transposase